MNVISKPGFSLFSESWDYLQVTKQREAGEPTIPTTIGQEKKFNPFMRVKESGVQKFAGCTDPIEVMGVIRAAKDKFRG